MKTRKVVAALSTVGIALSVLWSIVTKFDFEPVLALISSLSAFLVEFSTRQKSNELEEDKFNSKNFLKMADFPMEGNVAKTYGNLDINVVVEKLQEFGLDFDSRHEYFDHEIILFDKKNDLDFSGKNEYRIQYYQQTYGMEKTRKIGVLTTDRAFFNSLIELLDLKKYKKVSENEFPEYNPDKERQEYVFTNFYKFEKEIFVSDNPSPIRYVKFVRINRMSLRKDLYPIEFSVLFEYRFVIRKG